MKVKTLNKLHNNIPSCVKTGVLHAFKVKSSRSKCLYFLSFSSIQIKVFSLSYYRLLQLYILLVQEQSLFLPEPTFFKNL